MGDDKEGGHSDTGKKHKESAPVRLGFAILTMSNTRTMKDDTSGKTIREQAVAEGHLITHHHVVRDDLDEIQITLKSILDDDRTDIIVMNGGTGISPADVTIEAVRPMFDKELSAFSALFHVLSYEKVGSVAMLSRAAAGIVKGKAVFCVPGSPRAVDLAMEKLILPEAGHIAKHMGDK